MRIIRGTIADPAYCAELERLSAECDPGLAERRIVPYTQAPPRTLHAATVAVVDAVQALFPLADDLGIVATDALYSALASLSFVADVAEEAGL